MKKKFYLVDVSSLFFRAFFAIRQLRSASGLPTNAIYGFLSMVLKLLREQKPDLIAFCLDRKDPSFRSEIYSDYKANRSEAPEDIIPQLPYISKIGELLGIACVESPRYEADDVIGTLAKWGESKGFEIYIVSGDKDFGQLVSDQVFMFDTMKDLTLNAQGVFEKWGIRPDQMIDYLSLVGDSSDNVPGVKGIGPKTAEKLLADFGTLDKIYENLAQIPTEGLRKKLTENKDNAYLSKRLVTIALDVKVSHNTEDYRRKPAQLTALKAMLEDLSFKNLDKAISFLSDETVAAVETVEVKSAEPVAVQKSFQEIPHREIHPPELDGLLSQGQAVWGLETTLGLMLAGETNPKEIYILRGSLSDWAKPLSNLNLQWLGYDLKNLWHQLKVESPLAKWDSLLAAYVLKPGDSLEFERVFTQYTGNTLSEALPGPSESLARHILLKEKLESEIHRVKGEKILHEMDFPLAPILYEMEARGICLDRELLKIQGKELTEEIQTIEKEIIASAGESFNIASPKQLGHILFEKLKLPAGKKTKTGFSTDNEVLEKLKSIHPIADLVLKYRELTKLRSTYVEVLPTLVKDDGRIHTTFDQALTTTGRLSSRDPNLQNIPIRTDRGARVRKAFVAPKGKLLLSADYSQVELRVLAHYSQDTNLIKAFAEDLDVHAMTASEVFQVKINDVSADQRRVAKAINFGIAYGQGAFGLAENLGIPRKEAQGIIDKYFLKFPGVQAYIMEFIEKAKRDGYVETLDGRRRYLDELRSQNPAVRKFGERAAINAPIQGTASDIVKKAMLALRPIVQSQILLQVHDELIFEGTAEELQSDQPKIIKTMESVVSLRVPLKVNAQQGHNWDEAH